LNEGKKIIASEVITNKLIIKKKSYTKLIFIFVGIWLFTVIAGILFIMYRPKIRILNDVQRDMPIIKRDIKGILTAVNTLVENDSIMNIKLAHFPTSPPIDVQAMSRVTSVYKERTDPITGERQFHTGIDYSAKLGTVVFAAATGIVEEAKITDGYGKMIKINHLNGYETLYGHLSKISAYVGKEVQKGDTIGAVGNTGQSTGAHLHYEISYLDRKINPKIFN
jgi:murein DD-endopeptidase MepM/ murein hydrolase activator NlpD